MCQSQCVRIVQWTDIGWLFTHFNLKVDSSIFLIALNIKFEYLKISPRFLKIARKIYQTFHHSRYNELSKLAHKLWLIISLSNFNSKKVWKKNRMMLKPADYLPFSRWNCLQIWICGNRKPFFEFVFKMYVIVFIRIFRLWLPIEYQANLTSSVNRCMIVF